VIRPRGELHSVTALELQDVLWDVFNQNPAQVVLDLRRIQFVDSCHPMLEVWAREASDRGIDLRFDDGRGATREVLQLTGTGLGLHFLAG
jgi:anti-anti-sigma factor